MNKKQKYIFSSVIVAVLSLGVSFFTPAPHAQAAECGDVKTSIISCKQKNSKNGGLEDNGVWGLLLIVLNIMTAGVGIVAVGGIVYGSILYASAGGNTEQVKKAIGIIRNVVIGLIAFIGMFAFLQFLIPGGIFTP